MKYPKINTIWKRDEANKFRIVEGDFSKPEFANIRDWLVTEKIDGTNIRVKYEKGAVRFDGRTDEAQIPAHLFAILQSMFDAHHFESNLDTVPQKMILYGEGYGPKIQKGGGLYRDDPGFILFDVWVDGWWLNRDSVEDIADKLNIPVVPVLGVMDYQKASELVKSNPASVVADLPKIAEGIVARSHPLVLFRDGTPVMWKLKTRDFT
jgi:ATP-dependent RNA circularization protein (DNA/RNA ligase family)